MTALPNAEWHFPPTSGGILYGYNNAGTEHFKQDPIGKLVREAIQNSLDAHEPGLPEVIVDIRECDVSATDIGAESLQSHLQQALRETASKRQEEGQQDYRKALRLSQQPVIPCLTIIDRNTTGLQERKWDSLIYEEGIPEKDGPGMPGGSFGIGKNASYNVAGLHAVIYSTRYTNGKKGRVEKMTGRAQLVSHPDPDDATRMLQHIGFYAQQNRQPIYGADIPQPFRLESPGTGLWIAGFAPDDTMWHDAAIRAAVDNFFHAIHNRRLVVNIHPKTASEPVVICHDTIDSILAGRSNTRAAHYYRAIRKEPSGTTEPYGDIGPLDVYINSAKGAPNRVAYINRRGMLITDTRERRRSNPFYPGGGQGGWPDYAAVVVATDDATDKYIRRMENPAHDIIATERLPAAEQKSARLQLDKAGAQIRDIIDQTVREQDAADISNLTELAEMFPDLDTAIPGNRELTARTVSPQPQPHQVTAIDDNSDRNADAEVSGYDLQDGDSSGDEEEGYNADSQGGNGGGGSNDNGNRGGGGGRGGNRPKAGRKAEATRHAIGEMVIMRTSPGQLAVALSPNANSRGKASFTIEHGGEVRWQESRLSIKSISRIEPTTAKAEHSDDVVTVSLHRGHKGPVTLILDIDQDVAYTGFGFSERQAPGESKTESDSLDRIRQLLAANHTQSEIAEQIGISRQRVSLLVRRHNLKGRQPS